MSKRTSANPNPAEAVDTQSRGMGLPPEFALLLNPEVARKRRELMQKKLADTTLGNDQRRRYLDTIVDNHLIEELKSA